MAFTTVRGNRLRDERPGGYQGKRRRLKPQPGRRRWLAAWHRRPPLHLPAWTHVPTPVALSVMACVMFMSIWGLLGTTNPRTASTPVRLPGTCDYCATPQPPTAPNRPLGALTPPAPAPHPTSTPRRAVPAPAVPTPTPSCSPSMWPKPKPKPSKTTKPSPKK